MIIKHDIVLLSFPKEMQNGFLDKHPMQPADRPSRQPWPAPQCLSTGPYGFVRATLCTTSMLQDYSVHRRPALCTMVQKGDLCPCEVWRFSFCGGSHRTCTKRTLFVHSSCTRARTHSIPVVDNEHGNQGSQCSSVPTLSVVWRAMAI